MINHVKLRPFDIHVELYSSIPSGSFGNAFVNLVIGGQSQKEKQFMKDVLTHRPIVKGKVLCSSQTDAEFYTSYFSLLDIRQWTNEEIKDAIALQRIRCRLKHEKKIQMDERSLLIFDDCNFNYWTNNKTINNLVNGTRGLSQSCYFIHKEYRERISHSTFRANINFVFLFHETRPDYLRWLFDDFAYSLFFTFAMFCDAMKQYATHQSCLVLRIQPSYKKEAYYYKLNPHDALLRELTDTYFHPCNYPIICSHQHT